jgi:carbon monoxide dehydrogenase subunit G
MIIQESFVLPFNVATSWEAFKGIPMLVSCMPGASLQADPITTEVGSKIDILFSVKLGPISGSFLGMGEVVYDDAQKSGIFSGSGVDRKSNSRVRGEAKFFLTPTTDQSNTEVRVNVDYSLSGPLAQFSRGAIVQELAASLTRDFANNLKNNIGRLTDNGLTDAVSDKPSPQMENKNTLDAGSLIWRVVLQKLKAIFHISKK